VLRNRATLAVAAQAAAEAAQQKAEETLRFERQRHSEERDAALAASERRISTKTLEISRLHAAIEKEGRSVRALEDVVDRLRAEKEGQQQELESSTSSHRVHVQMLRLLVGYARLRFEGKSKASATATTTTKTAKTDGAVTALTDVTQAPAPAPVVPTTVSRAQNTEPMQDGEEVLKLRALVQKLHGDLDALRAAAPAPSAPPAPVADPAVSALLTQGMNAMRALAEAAQAGSEHKLAVERLQGEMTSYQHMAQAAMSAPQPQWMGYVPHYYPGMHMDEDGGATIYRANGDASAHRHPG
jgi:hypothetical protein